MAVRLRARRDTLVNWQSANPILGDGEFAVVKDGSLQSLKLGDGATNFNSLQYWSPVEIVDNLESISIDKSLSANQGRVLRGMIDTINNLLLSDNSKLDSLQEVVDFIEINKDTLDTLGITSIAGLQSALDSKVNIVAGKELSDNNLTDDLLTLLTTKKVKDISLNPTLNIVTIAYTDGTSADKDFNSVVNDIFVNNATLDASTNVLTLTNTTGGADIVVDLSDFVNSSELGSALSGKVDRINTTATTIANTDLPSNIYNIEDTELVSGLGKYYHILNMGGYSGSNYASQISIPYVTNGGNHLLFRTADATVWNGWNEVWHDGNFNPSAYLSNANIFTNTNVFNNGIQVKYQSSTKVPLIALQGVTNYGLFHTEGTNDKYSFDFSGVEYFTIAQDKNHILDGTLDLDGVILTSPNSTKYKLTANDDGSLQTTAV